MKPVITEEEATALLKRGIELQDKMAPKVRAMWSAKESGMKVGGWDPMAHVGIYRTKCCGEKDYDVEAMRTELTEWRSGRRHVFWRVKWRKGRHWVSGSGWTTLEQARSVATYIRSTGDEAKVFRVTVRPKR